MLGRALCLVLVLQYVLGDGHNSVQEIIDRIGDYAETLGLETERDEFYWESEYWRPPFQNVMMCPDGYGWEGDFEDGHCEPCQAGYFSDRNGFGLQSRCMPCLPGEFESAKGQGWCEGHCRYATTFWTGSTSESECVDPDEMFGEGSFESKVSVEVSLTGDWSFLNDILMEASGINFYEARGSVDYNEEDHVSIVDVTAMLPNNIAVHAHAFLLQFRTYKDSINDYVALGDHYTKIIFDMLNNAETLKEFGWHMNHEQLRVKDIEILDVNVFLEQHCEDGYRSEEWEGVGTKCIKDDRDSPSLKNSVFIPYVGESDDCMSLGGEARLRVFVRYNWPFPCMEEDECEAHFSTCNTLNSGECAIIIHLIFYDEEAGQGTIESNLNRAREVDYLEGSTFKYSEENSYKFRDSDDCGANPVIASDGSFSCSRGCDADSGERLARCGNCMQCPYGTWFNDDSEDIFPRCHSCSFYQSMTIFGNVPKRADDCLNGGHFMNRNSDGVWSGYGDYIDADMEFDVKADVEMNLCKVMEIKQDFDNFCSEKFSMESMALDDFTDFDVEMLGCLVMQEFSEIYEHSCDDFDRSWSDIMDDFEWEDVACFVAKGVHEVEERDRSCEDLSFDDKTMTMPFELSERLDDSYWSNAFYLPLLSHVRKMERFDTNALSMTIEGLLRKVGMYEMTDLTGMMMMDHVRDMILAIPRGVGVAESTFAFTTTDDDIFCDDGSVRVNCYWDESCERQQCGHEVYTEDELQCSSDPCNGCQPKWFRNGESVTCKTKQDCSVPNNVNNARLFSTYEREYVDYDQLCEGCDNPVRTYKYVCDDDYRLDNIKEPESGDDSAEYDDDSAYDDYSGSECEEEEFYCKVTDYEINRLPNCVRDNCKYEDLDNGYIKKIHAERDSPCRCAEYECNPGYEMEGKSKVYCSPDGSYTEMPRCVKAECQFPEEIKNARFIMEYRNWRGDREAWYQCQRGTSHYGDVYITVDDVECGEESQCERQNYCPVVIENGYLMREWRWDEYETYIGEYRCDEGFELRNPKIFSASSQDYEEMYGWGACGQDHEMDPDPENLPRCVEPGSPDPCNMPERIMNGYRLEEIRNEEFDLVDQASYRCNSGYMMVETWKGDIGWCRHDGTYELPYCVTPREYMTVEFELVPGMSKRENAGRVRARDVYADGSKGEWYAGCDDHFNGPAAGAICRKLGFRYGKQITADKKMKPIEGIPFGKTNVWCYHDDTLITSPSCNADDYGQLGWPLCTPEEQIAVHCFDEMWKVDVGFNMVAKNGKMSCPVMAWKEGNEMKMKNLDIHVRWGGVHFLAGDDYDVEYFEEGVHYIPQGKFSKKKGFKARFIGNAMDYDCFFCDVFMGDHIMNPWADKNHNCHTEDDRDD